MLASEIKAMVQEVVSDTSGVTYTDPQVFEWINEAIRTIIGHIPDALVVLRAIQLTPGTKQALPDDGLRLLGVIRNMGADGTTAGDGIRGPVKQEIMDSFNPGWHNDLNANTKIEEYIYSDSNPLQFYVYPQVPATPDMWVEARISIEPTAITADGDNIPVVATYQAAVNEWVLYRLLGRDSEKTPNSIRSAGHLTSFYNVLGVKQANRPNTHPRKIENS